LSENRLNELVQEFQDIKERWKHRHTSAQEYLVKLNEIGIEYIQILDSLVPPQPVELEVKVPASA